MVSPRATATPSGAPSHIRRVDAEGPRPELNIGADQVAFVVVKAREFDEKQPAAAEDEGSNPADDPIVALVESNEDSTAHELASFIGALSDDAQHELVAMLWLGRGDYGADEWTAAVADARDAGRRENHAATYLLGTPLLGDLIEEGYNQLGYSCTDEEAEHL